MNALDITDFTERGEELVKKVIETVAPKSAFIFIGLPDTIEMTEDQYDSLLDQDELQAMSEYSEILSKFKQSKDKLFYTPHNVMEVKVKGLAE